MERSKNSKQKLLRKAMRRFSTFPPLKLSFFRQAFFSKKFQPMYVDNKTMEAEKWELKGEEEHFDMTHISERSSSYQIRIYLWT